MVEMEEVVEMLEGLVSRWVSVLKRRMRLLFIGEWREEEDNERNKERKGKEVEFEWEIKKW